MALARDIRSLIAIRLSEPAKPLAIRPSPPYVPPLHLTQGARPFPSAKSPLNLRGPAALASRAQRSGLAALAAPPIMADRYG